MSWNPVLNKVLEIKWEFISKYGEAALWDYDKTKTTCLEYWVSKTGNGADFIAPLMINEYNDFILLKYKSLIDTFDDKEFWDKWDGIYRECRSVVLDVKNECVALAAMRKFFNINERPETDEKVVQKKIDNASIVEFSNKLDGSYQAARWYKGEVLLSGSSAINPDNSWRVAAGYKYIEENKNIQKMLKYNPDLTFIFEFIHPDDIHVVHYDENMYGLHLISIRSALTGCLYDYASVETYGKVFNVSTTCTFNTDFSSVLNSLGDKKSNEAEGFVINVDGERYKIKYNDYVIIHKALTKLVSPNSVIEAIKNDIYDDFYAKVPSAYKSIVDEMRSNIFAYCGMREVRTEIWYAKMQPYMDSRKEFMIAVDKEVPQEYRGAVRNIYLNKNTDWLSGVKYYQMVDILKSEGIIS